MFTGILFGGCGIRLAFHAGIVSLRATVTLPGTAWNVVLLDSAGSSRAQDRKLSGPLEMTPADASIWYLLER